MPIENLELWVDNVDLIRLPALESDVSGLQGRALDLEIELSSKSQEFTDRLDAHDVGIVAARSLADGARAVANVTSSRVYEVDLASRIYTDNKIQILRDELNSDLSAFQQFLDTDLLTLLSQEVDGRLPDFEGVLDQRITEAQTILNQLELRTDEVMGVVGQVLDVDIPAQNMELDVIKADLTDARNKLDTAFQDFPYTTVLESLEFNLAASATQTMAIGTSVLRAPAVHWTIESASTAFTGKAPALPSWFITDDPIFGDCVELPFGGNITIGQAYPVDFDHNRVYRVTLKVRAVNDGALGGVDLAMGVSTWEGRLTGPVAAELNSEIDLTAVPLSAGLGSKTYEVYFSGNQTLMQNTGLSIGTGAANNAILLTGSANANKAFFHVRQNSQADTDGQVRVAILKVEDATATLKAGITGGSDSAAAEEAAQLAQNARDQAQAAKDAAETAQSASFTSAQDAANAATAAGESATSAAINESVASANATAAAQSASAAQTSMINAETAAGNAESSATQAASSFQSATLAANTASESATLATEARFATEEAVTLSDVSLPGLPYSAWTDNSTGVNKDTPPEAHFVTDDDVFGKAYHTPNTNNVFGQSKPVPYVHGRVYEVTYRYRVIDDGSDNEGCLVAYGVNLWRGQTSTGLNIQVSQIFGVVARTVSEGTIEERVQFAAVLDDISSPDWERQIGMENAEANEAYFHIRANLADETTGRISVGQILVRDVTEQVSSMRSASASAESASMADSRATDSAAWASAANASRIDAETARTNAVNAEVNAVAAKEDAEGALSIAKSARDLAVSSANAAEDSAGFAGVSEQNAASSASDAAGSATSAARSATVAAGVGLAADTAREANLRAILDNHAARKALRKGVSQVRNDTQALVEENRNAIAHTSETLTAAIGETDALVTETSTALASETQARVQKSLEIDAQLEDVSGEINDIKTLSLDPDSALASSVSLTMASLGSTNLVRNGNLSTGDLNGWTNVSPYMKVTRRDSSADTWVSSAPAPFMLEINGDDGTSNYQTARITPDMPINPGEQIEISYATTRVGSGPAVGLYVQARWLDGGGNQLSIHSRRLDADIYGWVNSDFEPFIPPENAEMFYLFLVRESGTGSALIANLNATKISADQAKTKAQVSNIEFSKVDADGATAAVEQKISARYGNLEALAEATAFAQSTADGIASGYVWRLNNENLMEMVSVDEGTDGPTTSIKLSPDYLEITSLAQIKQAVIEQLVADDAFIENLIVRNANLAGPIQSDNFVNGKEGWVIYRNGGAQFNGVVLSRELVLHEFTVNDPMADMSLVNTGIRVGAEDFWNGNIRALVGVARFEGGFTATNVTDFNNVFFGISCDVLNAARWNGFSGNPQPRDVNRRDPSQMMTPSWATGTDQRVFVNLTPFLDTTSLNGGFNGSVAISPNTRVRVKILQVT